VVVLMHLTLAAAELAAMQGPVAKVHSVPQLPGLVVAVVAETLVREAVEWVFLDKEPTVAQVAVGAVAAHPLFLRVVATMAVELEPTVHLDPAAAPAQSE